MSRAALVCGALPALCMWQIFDEQSRIGAPGAMLRTFGAKDVRNQSAPVVTASELTVMY